MFSNSANTISAKLANDALTRASAGPGWYVLAHFLWAGVFLRRSRMSILLMGATLGGAGYAAAVLSPGIKKHRVTKRLTLEAPSVSRVTARNPGNGQLVDAANPATSRSYALGP